MKFSLIAAVVVLALAQGSLAQDLSIQEKIAQYFEEAKTKMTEEFNTLINNQDLANQASTFLQDKKAQLEPIATQLQQQVQAAASTMQDQIKPLADNVQTQMQPMIDDFQKKMEELIRMMTEQARAIGN